MSNADYHADFSAVSASMLKVFRRSRREYEARFVTRTMDAEPPSDPMKLGSLAHAMLLEPETVEQYVVIPSEVLASNGAKIGKKWTEFAEANAGRELLKEEDFDTARRMVESIRNRCGEWFTNGLAEHELRWTCDDTGLPCKAKVDYILPRLIIDVKTAGDASPKGFRSSVANYDYHLQEAHYRHGARIALNDDVRFLFVVVQSKPPYQCRVYETPHNENAPPWSQICKETAGDAYRQAMRALMHCYTTNDFSAPGESEVTILYHEDCR